MRIFVCIYFIFFSWSSLAVSPKEPYLVHLAAKSKLISLDGSKDITTEKEMYVYVLEENPNNRNQFWIYDTKKEKKYITSSFNIIELDPELRLLPPEDGNKIYRQKRILQVDDTNLSFETNFNLHFEQVSTTELKSLYPTQPGSSNSIRYEVRTFYQTHSSFQFGANLNYQGIVINNAEEQVNISLLSIGPNFRYKILQNEKLTLSFLTSAEFTPLAKGKSSLNSDEFSAHAYDIGFEGEVLSEIGWFTIGTHLRRSVLQLNNTSRIDTNLLQSEYNLSSLGLCIGYKLDWNL